jgi:hypothetical protein
MSKQTALALVNTPIPFDYAALYRPVEVSARSDAALVKGLMRRTAEDLIDIGTALIRQKDSLPHGMFLPWIEAEFVMSENTALRMMNVARAFGGKSASVADLTPTALYELAAPSTPLEVTIEVQRRIDDGELVTAADIRELKNDYAEVVNLASEKTAQLTAAEQTVFDLTANAHRLATEESDKRYGARISDLERQLATFATAVTASIQANPTDDNVVAFVPKDEGEPIVEGDPLAGGAAGMDIADHGVGAHAIYGAMSVIDLAQTTPEAFWAIFGTASRQPRTLKWLKGTLKTLNAIRKGMPK